LTAAVDRIAPYLRLQVLQDHLNAEIVAGTIANRQEAMDYLTWTYFFRRLLMNPTYYELQDIGVRFFS